MKTMKKLMALCLSLMMIVSCIPAVYAADREPDPVDPSLIDTTAKGSVTIYKYDITGAEKDGVWDSSYVSTGIYDESVNDTLGGAIRDGDTDDKSDLGNGGESYGYAIAGVEFTMLKVADIVQFSEDVDGNTALQVLYSIDKTKGADFLKTIGLADGKDRYEAADSMDATKYFYQSDVLVNALSAALQANATTVKNSLENYVTDNGGTALPLTNEYGKTEATDLELGLFLCAETKTAEMITVSCNPFLLSVPMTQVSGGNSEDGGIVWLYDITLYPKNQTGNPSLEKTLRENISDTGKNDGSTDDITDGYAHAGTASDGDIIDYQLVSTLPAITSEATYLSAYTFVDTLSAGLSYNKNDVVLEFFKDAACTDLITTWTQADGKFSVSYGTAANNATTMTIEMTEQGLEEINTANTVYTGSSMVNSGYSDCTVRITYKATMHMDDSVIYGDSGNPNEVVLMWKRSSTEYYDTLVDDAHVFTYAVELTKTFSDGKGDFSKVEFILKNDTDGYYVKAELDEQEGVYYVVDHVADKNDATHFVPVETGENAGLIYIKGLEDDSYTCTEVRTADGYTLLKDDIEIVISQTETTDLCDIYASDVLGLIQNDPRFAEAQIAPQSAQQHLEHHLLTASATVDGNKVNMKEDDGSLNAAAPLKVVNTSGFDLPQTGDRGTWMFSVIGILMMAGAAAAMILVSRKSRSNRR